MATVRYLVSDVARSLSFYRELLEFEEGLEMLPAVPTNGRDMVGSCPDGQRVGPLAGR